MGKISQFFRLSANVLLMKFHCVVTPIARESFLLNSQCPPHSCVYCPQGKDPMEAPMDASLSSIFFPNKLIAAKNLKQHKKLSALSYSVHVCSNTKQGRSKGGHGGGRGGGGLKPPPLQNVEHISHAH